MPKRILLIEHDKKRGFHFAKTINKNGYSCDVVNDGISAIEQYVHMLGKGTSYDLILLDAHLPNSDTAITSTAIRSIEREYMRIHRGFVPIIGLTDDSRIGKDDGKQMGMTTVKPKPIDGKDLLAVLMTQ